MLFKTLLLSSCAVVVMASSYSASAMMNESDEAPAAPANPQAQSSQRATNSIAPDERDTGATNSTAQTSEDDAFPNVIRSLAHQEQVVLRNLISEMSVAKIGDLYNFTPKTEEQIKDHKLLRAHMRPLLLEKIQQDIMSPELKERDDTQARREKKAIENKIEAEVKAAIATRAAAGKPINVFDLWESGAVDANGVSFEALDAYMEVKSHLDKMDKDTQNIYISALKPGNENDADFILTQGKYFSINEEDTTVQNIAFLAKQRRSLREIPPLDRFGSLVSINAENTEITSLERLSKMPSLRSLELAHTQIQSLKGLENVPNLTSLDLSRAPLTTLKDMGKMEKLERLSLYNSEIESLNGIEGAPNLKTLDLSGSYELKSLKGVENLTQLEKLRVTYSESLSLKGVEQLPTLKHIVVYGRLDDETRQILINLRDRGVRIVP